MEAAARLSHFASSRFDPGAHADRPTGFRYGVPRRAVQLWGSGGRREAVSLDELKSPCGLFARVLKSGQERTEIAELRKLAAFGVEQDLGLDLAQFEGARDELGIVTAVYHQQKVIATIRLVPVGQDLTAAERMRSLMNDSDAILGGNSWEIGRIIMAPEDRDPALLPRCLGLTLTMLLKHRLKNAQHFHASTTLPMARLWRHFGMTTALTAQGASGKKYALVHGDVSRVAHVLKAPYRAPAEKTPSLLFPAFPQGHMATPAFS